MQTAEDWRRGDSVANRDRMAVRIADDRINDRTLRKAGPQTRVWPAAIVMGDPLPKSRANVLFADRNDEVYAFAADRADHTFAERIRLRSEERGFEDRQTHRLKGAIDAFRVDRVAIVDHESLRLFAQYDHPKLFCRPVPGRVLVRVTAQNA